MVQAPETTPIMVLKVAVDKDYKCYTETHDSPGWGMTLMMALEAGVDRDYNCLL